MIQVEGHKAFHGVMRITPKSNNSTSLELQGDFIYKPDTDCWYHKAGSFPGDICTIVRDLED